MIISLESRTALVTGAGSGIGRQIAVDLAKAGANVALLGRKEEALLATRDQVLREGVETLVVPCDLTDVDAIRALPERLSEGIGAIDTLVNNAGGGAVRVPD